MPKRAVRNHSAYSFRTSRAPRNGPQVPQWLRVVVHRFHSILFPRLRPGGSMPFHRHASVAPRPIRPAARPSLHRPRRRGCRLPIGTALNLFGLAFLARGPRRPFHRCGRGRRLRLTSAFGSRRANRRARTVYPRGRRRLSRMRRGVDGPLASARRNRRLGARINGLRGLLRVRRGRFAGFRPGIGSG